MLRKVRIQNFKSLKDVTLELQKVNLLIGPNNSGKSNFLKGLEKFKEISNHFNNYKKAGETLKQEDFFAKKDNIELSFSFASTDNHQMSPIFHFEDGRIEMKELVNLNILDDKKRTKVANEQESLNKHFKNLFENVLIHKPDPNSYQKPFPILPNQSLLSSNASNMVAFFDTLRDEYPENFKAIEEDLTTCIPELSGLRFESVKIQSDDNLYKIYGDKTFKRLGLFDKLKKITYWADELSEGTLYFLALLCIIHQPNPPKLLLLEEPEKGIHPRRIHEIMKFIFQLVEDKDIQVIMTSHNEHVLEEFTTIPEAVFIFDKDDEGATFVKNLQKDIIEPGIIKAKEFGIEPIDYTDNIGENWFMGLMGGVPA